MARPLVKRVIRKVGGAGGVEQFGKIHLHVRQADVDRRQHRGRRGVASDRQGDRSAGHARRKLLVKTNSYEPVLVTAASSASVLELAPWDIGESAAIVELPLHVKGRRARHARRESHRRSDKDIVRRRHGKLDDAGQTGRNQSHVENRVKLWLAPNVIVPPAERKSPISPPA